MFFRTILHMLLSGRAPALDVHDVARLPLRVWPTDLDLLGHMNNGVYLSIMDLGRFDLLIRAGTWARFQEVGYYPVVSSETITFRKSLQPWQRYVLETRIAGYDGKAVFVQQRFTVDGEIYAEGLIRGRFLKKSGGVVSIAELSAVAGIDVSDFVTPEWITRWATDVALPPTRAEAPSDWSV
jgi:acyl-CoA thioesterase FadM